MLKKIALIGALASLTVGCATTSADEVNVHEKTGVTAPMVKLTPSTKVLPLVKLTPAIAISAADRASVLACIELVKPEVVRPTTINPDLVKTKIVVDGKNNTVVKMPFTVLNGFNKDEPILATCTFTQSGKGVVELADI